MEGVAAGAAMVDTTLRAVATDTGFDRGKVEIASELAVQDLVAIEAGETFFMEGVVEFSNRHPAVRSKYVFDRGGGVITYWLGNLMAGGTAREGCAATAWNLAFHVRKEDGALKVLTSFVEFFQIQPLSLDVFAELLATGDALAAGVFLILNVEAAEESTHVVGIAVRKDYAGAGLVASCRRIKLQGVALHAVLFVSDRSLVLAAAIALMAVGTIELSGDFSRAEVDGMIEFQGVRILRPISDLAEFWVICVKGSDDIRVTTGRALARLNLQIGVR